MLSRVPHSTVRAAASAGRTSLAYRAVPHVAATRAFSTSLSAQRDVQNVTVCVSSAGTPICLVLVKTLLILS